MRNDWELFIPRRQPASQPSSTSWLSSAVSPLLGWGKQQALQAILNKSCTTITIKPKVFYYKQLLRFLERNRFQGLGSQLYYEDRKPQLAPGTSFCRWNGTWVKAHLTGPEVSQEVLSLSFFLTSREDALALIKQFSDKVRDKKKSGEKVAYFDVFVCQGKEMLYVKTDNARPRSSIFIEDAILDNLEQRLTSFENRNDWYAERGIPYKHAILLHGPPGTGKTTLAKYVAGFLSKPLVVVSPAELSNHVQTASGRVLLLEDIDCDSAARKRTKNDSTAHENPLGAFINTLDGAAGVHDCVIVATTNHIDLLDEAVLRKGRFDDIIEVRPLTPELIRRMVRHFFSDPSIDSFSPNLRDATGAEIQDVILANYTEGPEKVVSEINRRFST